MNEHEIDRYLLQAIAARRNEAAEEEANAATRLVQVVTAGAEPRLPAERDRGPEETASTMQDSVSRISTLVDAVVRVGSPRESAAPAEETKGAGPALAASFAELRATAQQQIGALAENTRVLSGASSGTAASGGSAAGSALASVGKALGSVFTSGLGMVKLATGLYRLFGGGDGATEAAPPVKYALPDPIRMEAGVMAGSRDIQAVDEGRGGAVRSTITAAPAQGRTAPPQITVSVNAIDSRSFLDHKDAIAAAVREAMLSSHAINDVVTEL